MGTREYPLPMCFDLLLGEERDRWPPEARLICAAHDGSVRKIKNIAKELDVQGHGIPVTVANTTYMGMNALDAAGGCGRLPVYRYLVEEVKMDVGKPDTAQGFTPLEYAVQNGHLPAVRYLLDRGADLHQQRSSLTLLHSAAVHGRSEIVKFLLSKGADVDALSDIGTPLTLASLRGHASILKILLQHNADPSKGNGVFVPLDMALNKSFVSCVKLLVQGRTNVNGDNPLAKAAEKGLTEAIKCLVEAGANPNVIDRDGIIKHVEMEIKQLEDSSFVKKKMSDIKQQADEAFKKQDYQNASVFYTQALKMDNFDAKLLSNRSLCLLRMGDGRRAYEDAADCTKLRPKWAKAHYREGAALMFMKEYDAAYSSLSRALELDPESEEIEKLFWEAMELK